MLGLRLKKVVRFWVVAAIRPDSPASTIKPSLHPEDLLLKVDQRPVTGKALDELGLLGPEGSEVELVMVCSHLGTQHTIKLVRATSSRVLAIRAVLTSADMLADVVTLAGSSAEAKNAAETREMVRVLVKACLLVLAQPALDGKVRLADYREGVVTFQLCDGLTLEKLAEQVKEGDAAAIKLATAMREISEKVKKAPDPFLKEVRWQGDNQQQEASPVLRESGLLFRRGRTRWTIYPLHESPLKNYIPRGSELVFINGHNPAPAHFCLFYPHPRVLLSRCASPVSLIIRKPFPASSETLSKLNFRLPPAPLRGGGKVSLTEEVWNPALNVPCWQEIKLGATRKEVQQHLSKISREGGLERTTSTVIKGTVYRSPRWRGIKAAGFVFSDGKGLLIAASEDASSSRSITPAQIDPSVLVARYKDEKIEEKLNARLVNFLIEYAWIKAKDEHARAKLFRRAEKIVYLPLSKSEFAGILPRYLWQHARWRVSLEFLPAPEEGMAIPLLAATDITSLELPLPVPRTQ